MNNMSLGTRISRIKTSSVPYASSRELYLTRTSFKIKKSSSFQKLSIFVFLLTIYNANATVTVPKSGAQYASQPAAFGMYFAEGREYMGRLQSLLDYDPYLCDRDHIPENRERIIVPGDGLPVAILAKKGDCTFEEKARIAQDLHPEIKYLLVYNNAPGDDHLITMSAGDPSGISLGALFVSYESGMDLQMQIISDDDVNEKGKQEGLRIYMDSYTNWDDLGWISWIFVLLTCMVSMFLCLSTGYIRANQSNVRVIIVNGTRQYEELLTEDDLDCLSEYEYHATDDDKTEDDDFSAASENSLDSLDKKEDTATAAAAAVVPTTDPEAQAKPELQFDRYSSCSICLEEFEHGEKLIKLPCTHYFHPNCINPWLTERQPTCPLCKANVKHDLERKRQSLDEDDATHATDASHSCCHGCTSMLHSISSCLRCLCDESLEDHEEDGAYININQSPTPEQLHDQDIISSNSPESIHSPLLENQYDVL